MAALTNRLREDIVGVINMMTNFELSETPSYMDNYVAALFLPHTDMDRFPILKKRISERKAILSKIRQAQSAKAKKSC
jgi:uncharacterized 2Fe-2S/4Fe-4S cluster protein (DUF4445 family)